MRTYDGKQIRLDDALGIRWTVIGFEIDPRTPSATTLTPGHRSRRPTPRFYRAGHRPQGPTGDSSGRTGLVDLEDTEGILTRWLGKAGHQPGTLVVLRPDRYVFGAETDGRS